MATGKARQYYVSQETHDTLTEIGDGNYSRGLRICAGYHERLVEALELLLHEVVESGNYNADDFGWPNAVSKSNSVLSDIGESKK